MRARRDHGAAASSAPQSAVTNVTSGAPPSAAYGGERRGGLGEGQPTPREAAERQPVPGQPPGRPRGRPPRPASRAAASTAGEQRRRSAARKAASSSASASQASGPITVSQDSSGTNVQPVDQTEQGAPARPRPRQSRTSRPPRPGPAATGRTAGRPGRRGPADDGAGQAAGQREPRRTQRDGRRGPAGSAAGRGRRHGLPVAVLVTVGAGPSGVRSAGLTRTTAGSATVRRTRAAGCGPVADRRRPRRRVRARTALRTDLVRPAAGSRPLSTGRSGPSRVSPPAGSLALSSDDGDRTWHPDGTCALRRPWPEAGTCVSRRGFRVGVLSVDVAHLGAPTASCQPPADLRGCAKPQVGATSPDRLISH